MTKHKIIITSDSSTTLFNEELGEHYHSIHGAKNESLHVFIEAGLMRLQHLPLIRVFEVGMGTGLNAFLTAEYAINNQQKIHYTAIEKYPVSMDCATKLDFGWGANNVLKQLFMDIHLSNWGKTTTLDDFFQLTKCEADLHTCEMDGAFDLIYFDAFSPEKQPDMWDISIFAKLFSAMNNNGILTTYCAKGEVRRTLQQAGFFVERIPGPTGKREMLRATKP